MDRRRRIETASEGVGPSPPSEAWLFAQAILGKPISNPSSRAADQQADRELLAWLASISDRHAAELRRRQSAEAAARRETEELQWLAQISEEHEHKLRTLLSEEAEAREAQQRSERLVESLNVQEAQWDPVKHPRGAFPQNRGWWSPTGGAGGTGGAGRSTSLLDKIRQRNAVVAELSGVVTPSMIRADRLAAELESAARLPGEVARAAAAGSVTGGKAVVNGLATSVKDVATLGLSPGQLELIGVTKDDQARGYDTAVAISTGSGQVLIAAGTGGIASALSKGGSVTRAASGALVSYDTAGNAVGVVQGVYDATQNGVTVGNGTQVAAGVLGFSANTSAAKRLISPRKPAPASRTSTTAPTAGFRVGKHGDMPSPRSGQHSHHGVMSAWMEKTYPGYDAKKAPAVLMPTTNHHATFGVYRKWRAEMAKRMDGKFDWGKVSEADMRELSEKMFDVAGVPASIRDEYWSQFETTKAALRRQSPPHALEARLWGEQVMSEKVDVLSAEEMQRRYGRFYNSSPMASLDKSKVPEQFWQLLPYAEFWGIADDWTRESLVKEAPPEVRQNLKQVVAAFDNALDEWLAGPEADNPSPTDEYLAFCAMGMAADFA